MNRLPLLALLALVLAFLPLHDAPWWPAPPRPDRWIAAVAALLAYAGFTIWILWRSRPRVAPQAAPGHASDPSDRQWLVAWASQTGFAQQLAARTAATLSGAGLQVQLRELGELDLAALSGFRRALFIASTTGEGDPPDPTLPFVRDVLAQPAALPDLAFAVLALGDREYEHFCGFGRRLDTWLRKSGATALFDLVEVDNGDPGALRHWQHHLGLLAHAPELPDWSPAPYEAWRLGQRRELNPDSAGASVFHIELAPPSDGQAMWQAGDIAEVGPCNPATAIAAFLERNGLADGMVQSGGEPIALSRLLARSHLPDSVAPATKLQALADSLEPLPHREYSISSLPADCSLQLLVRQMRRADGKPGLGSGWLCQHAEVGSEIAVRIRANPNFHPPAADRPLILVGNGTGIAGLRAHLKARVAAGARRTWLLFGERNADRDWFHRDEIEAWHAQGAIERVDTVFSRDDGAHRYVQDALLGASAELREWVAGGASIYVCGSLQGMAPGVDKVLRETLGDAEVERMLAERRYRRDVY